jgi:transcriptional regulator with XRE-family HTH domain
MAKQTAPAGMRRLRDLVDEAIRARRSRWAVESEAAGLGRSTLHNVLHGRQTMRTDTAKKIARHFGLSELEVFELAGLATPRRSGDPLTDALVAVREAPVDHPTREALVLLLQAAAGRDEAWRQRVREAVAEVERVMLTSLAGSADEVPAEQRVTMTLERLKMRLLE